MQPAPFHSALSQTVKPLEFAAADNFARVRRVQGLCESVAMAAEAAAALAIPKEAAATFARLAKLFAAKPEGAALQKAVARALEMLAPLRAENYAQQALARGVECLPGIGPKRAAALAKRGLGAVGDLLFHLPNRYLDRRAVTKIGALKIGAHATCAGEVLLASLSAAQGRRRGMRIFHAVLSDGSGSLGLKWFRGGDALSARVKKGARLRASGEVKRFRFDKEMVHPEIDLLAKDETAEGAGLVPNYAAPENIPPRTFRTWMAAAIAQHADLVPSFLPPKLAQTRGLPPIPEALREIHSPRPEADPAKLLAHDAPYLERLVLEELYVFETGLALRRAQRARQPGTALPQSAAVEQAGKALPFALTGAQRRAWGQIARDLAQPHPMQRLLQGDVGSGKTVLAALAAVAASAAGCQAALMAPTELLAEQHHRTLQKLIGAQPGMRVALLSASLPKAEAQRLRAALAAGEIPFVVGTHALAQKALAFRKLALVVVDEQHRFGVLQRRALAEKAPAGFRPHTLVMTATPIPRSLALTAYGDLDVSVLDELPPGRKPARTLLLRPHQGGEALAQVRATLARGEQVYVVYPLVEESENSDLRAATDRARAIAKALPDARVDLMHGRLKAEERAAVMARFEAGETRLLVSTTVVEVGVDVPNATLMVIEHAERFGLAQLHQLRGRVGRGARAGLCIMIARGGAEESEARLRAMLQTTDGFAIADADLRIRGPGEFLGAKQSGHVADLRLADLVRDARLVSVAREAALATVRENPGLSRLPQLAAAVQARWGERLQFVGSV